MSFYNIPEELRLLRQWGCWRLEFAPPMAKPTKPFYVAEAGYGKASVTNPKDWRSFEEAIAAPLTCLEPCHPETPISQTGYSGIGFVFSQNDKYSGIDCDDTHGDEAAKADQLKIYRDFNSYTELSPSGNGIHIIVIGKVPNGRRRANVELYPHARYFTMTGNVINNVPIQDRNDLLQILYKDMGGNVLEFQVKEELTEIITDENLMAQAAAAVNGEKFTKLFNGDWHSDYPSPSEADMALYNILGFYSKHRLQCRRLFRQSVLGQREKAERDAYLDYMFVKSFDNQLPEINYDGLLAKFEEQLKAKSGAATGEPGSSSIAAPGVIATLKTTTLEPGLPLVVPIVNQVIFPPGLIGEIAAFFLATAPRPVPEIALAGAIAYLAGITGRAFNVSGTGLNQYIMLLAQTGVGKDAIADGISKLNSEVIKSVPGIIEFKGPGELVSSAGLIKWLNDKPCCLSILGEFGKKMKEMAAPNANAHLTGISRVLLQMYSKSGFRSTFDSMAYSDTTKNTAPIKSPSLSILGESVPESFYESLDESMIADGLLPRFMIFEYKGERSYLNKSGRAVTPPANLVQKVADLAAHCLRLHAMPSCHDIELAPDAEAKFDEFDVYTTDVINLAGGEIHRQLWNRAHLKALKLAALQAVGENPLMPVINMNHTLWATGIVVEQTNKLLAKYETGNVGQIGGSEGKQLAEVIRVIGEYRKNPHEAFAKYGGTYDMHNRGVIAESHIQRRLISTVAFKNDRLGATNGIKRAIKTLLDADELREMPKLQMQKDFGNGAKSYVVSNPDRFV